MTTRKHYWMLVHPTDGPMRVWDAGMSSVHNVSVGTDLRGVKGGATLFATPNDARDARVKVFRWLWELETPNEAWREERIAYYIAVRLVRVVTP